MGKATIHAIVESFIHSTTNQKLIDQNRKKESKANRAKGNFGHARYMNEVVLKEREDREQAKKDKDNEAEKAKNKKAYEDYLKEYLKKITKHFGPHIFVESKALKLSLSQNSAPKRVPPGPAGPLTTPRAPCRPAHRIPKVLKSCLKRPRMIITLYIRVSNQELQARQALEGQGAVAEQQRSHVLAQSGRGMRARKPSRR